MDYYTYLDYSERLVGFIIIKNEQILDILPKISKLHHYKDIKNKDGYIKSIKCILDKNNIKEYLLKWKIKELKDNISLFVEIIDFVKNNEDSKIFISVDNNLFNTFTRLLSMIPHKNNLQIVRESELKKGSIEYRLNLIIDTMLNIERRKMSK